MTAITMPWYFLIYVYVLPSSSIHPYLTIPPYLILLAIFWSGSVMLSRVYNGHHTPLDVAVGAGLGVVILYVWTCHLRQIFDATLIRTLSAPLVVAGIFVSVLILHPVPPKATPAHAETGLVTGTAMGAFLSSWVREVLHARVTPTYAALCSFFHVTPCTPAPCRFSFLPENLIVLHVLRFIVGVALVMVVRLVVKTVATVVVVQTAKLLNKNTKYTSKAAFKHSEAEVAVKFVTYTAVSFTVGFFAPVAYALVGLHLPIDDSVYLQQ